jgi:hypothetical protein
VVGMTFCFLTVAGSVFEVTQGREQLG